MMGGVAAVYNLITRCQCIKYSAWEAKWHAAKMSRRKRDDGVGKQSQSYLFISR